MAHTFKLLEELIDGMKGPPNWDFRLEQEEDTYRFVITTHSHDNYAFIHGRSTDHYHPVPHAGYNEATWRRWIFDKCCATCWHELGELIRFGKDEVRPFAPMHGPGEDPYTVHEFRPEIDFLTTQTGKLREGPI